jgi:hypothetical protein
MQLIFGDLVRVTSTDTSDTVLRGNPANKGNYRNWNPKTPED